MNILVASVQLPWPLDSGGKVAVYSSLACLRNDHHFTLVYPVWDESGISDAVALQERLPEIKVRRVYCGPTDGLVTPKDDFLMRTAKWGARQYRRLRTKQTRGVAAEQKEEQIPVYPFVPLPEAFVDAVADELSHGIDLVQAEFAEMLSLGPWLPEEIPKVFIHHQLHFIYARRFAAARKRGGYFQYLESVMRVQEGAYLRKFDGVIVFSEEDKRALAEWLPDENVHVSPFPIASASATFDGQCDNHFSFVGSGKHFPNRDALEWLKSKVWPEILKQRPCSKLEVIGWWEEGSKTRFSEPGIEFMGYVPDLEKAIKGSVLIVPLRIGSGIRVKLLDAMSQGVPAVSTSIGCEGIPVTDGLDILIRDDPAEFAAAAVELLNNPELRARLANAGKDLVAKFYSSERVRQRRNEIYRIVCERTAGLNYPKR